MAEESFDDFDTAENDEVLGGGGYVDDHIDIDDDDDDDPFVPSTPRSRSTSKLVQSPSLLSKRSALSSPTLPRAKKPRTTTNEYMLRSAGTGNLRDYFVAKFVNQIPDLKDSPHFRMYRDREATLDGRKEGLQAHRKQQDYYSSYSGRQRMQRYKRQGIDVVPDRAKKGMTIEISPHPIAHQLAETRKKKNERKLQAFQASVSRSATLPGVREEPQPEEPDPPELTKHLQTYTGVFDGKTRNTRYAIMVMNSTDKTVDVVPIDEYAWFTFRAEGNVAAVNEEKPETARPKKLENRLARFTDRYNAFQMKRDHALGDDSRILNTGGDFAEIGIRRKKSSYQEVEMKGEDLDFDEEFADDDLAQVDKETVEKPVARVQGDAEQNARNFRKLIKDEPRSESPPRSPGSESEEEAAPGQGSRQPSRTASPSRPPSGSRSPKEATGSSPHHAARQGTPMGTTPSNLSPSPSRSSRGSTPRRAEVAHLLPAPGIPPTKEQVVAVLRILLKGRPRMVFKEFMSYFQANTSEQKSHLQGILRSVAIVSSDPKRPKKYFISLKPES